MLIFHLPQTTCGTRHKASASPESQPSSSEAGTQLTDFSQNTPNPPRTIPVHDVIHIPRSYLLSGIFILTSLNDISSPRAWTPVLMLHLTNPCAKWKVLSLTKPKGKMYKTKSLGHYITLGFRFKLVLRCLCWYYVGCVGITLVILVLRWFLSPR